MKHPQTRPKLAVIDYGMGNLHSVVRAWEQVGAEVCIVSQPQEVQSVDALIFPGQGAMVDAMDRLQQTHFDRVIQDWIAADRPFFGICLGLQALFEHSEEGDCAGLGVFKGTVRRFSAEQGLKIPHMGWNRVRFKAADTLTAGLASGEDQFYFVHSYYVQASDPCSILFEVDYGLTFCAGIRVGNCVATQFHPEKSQAVGLRLYKNFLSTL